MYIILLVILLFILFDLAALRWGANSLETFNSAEWERRAQRYYGPEISRHAALDSYCQGIDNKHNIAIKNQEKNYAQS
jgi:hypothetical protein